GKSMVADALGRELRAPVLSVDPIEAALWRAGVDRAQPTGYAAYAVADAQARSLLALGLDVVIDAVNNIRVAQDGWIAVAREVRVPLRVVEVVCSDLDLHAERLARRDRGLGPELEPDWDRVLERRAESEPWPVDHLTLDSVDDPAANLTRALAYVADMAR
ncbi:MAG TPA: AAA family ATPase, partial [Micromonosporaceae bacterium]